jgi:hypothetical protein
MRLIIQEFRLGLSEKTPYIRDPGSPLFIFAWILFAIHCIVAKMDEDSLGNSIISTGESSIIKGFMIVF